MSKTNVTIKTVNTDNELYCKYANQNKPQSVYISLDLRDGTLSCEVNHEINAIPVSVYTGIVVWYGPIPVLRARPANQVLEDFSPIAQAILDNVDNLDSDQPKWIDGCVADRLENRAQDFAEQVEYDYPDESDRWEPYDLDSYYGSCSLSDIGEFGLTQESSDEDVRSAVAHEIAVADYPLDGDEDDLFDYFTKWMDYEKADNG